MGKQSRRNKGQYGKGYRPWMAHDLVECLDVACENGQAAMVRLLLKHGADVHKAANGNRTPIHVAACGGHTEVARLLLASGADIEREDEDGKTPMAIAESKKHSDIVALLVEHKAGLQTAPAPAPAAAAEAPAPAAPGLEPCL